MAVSSQEPVASNGNGRGQRSEVRGRGGADAGRRAALWSLVAGRCPAGPSGPPAYAARRATLLARMAISRPSVT